MSLVRLLSYPLILVVFSLTTVAKTADELLASGTPESQGEAIALEFDERDIGFESQRSAMKMILRNKQGQESTRAMRTTTLEEPSRDEGDKSLIIFDSPGDVKGTALLSHAKILEPDNQWLYLPALKRVKRISSKNKSGPFVGSEFAYEDITGNEIGKYSWKYLTKETVNGLECFKLESTPKYENSGYTKRLVWMDTKAFRLQKIEFYDRKDALLKTQTYSGYKQYLDKFWRADVWKMINHQTDKSTDLMFENYEFKIDGLSEKDFRKNVLKRIK